MLAGHADFAGVNLPYKKTGGLAVPMRIINILTGVGLAIMPMLVPAGHAMAVEQPTTARSVVVSRTQIADETPVGGTVAGTETYDARARIGGTVVKVLVERGDVVKKGQLLAVIEDTKLPGQVAAATQQRAAAEAAVALAETNLKRMQSLLPLDAASPLQVEQAETQLKAAQAQLAATNMQASGVEGASTDGRVVAPAAGVVSVLRGVAGTIVMPGEPVATVDSTPLVVRLALPQRHAGVVSVGDEIPLELPMGMVTGTVSRVYPAVENGRFRIDVKAEGLEALKAGEKVTARVQTGTHMGIVVPKGAVTGHNGLSFVTLKKGGQITVQPGAAHADGTVEILSGLNDGDEVLIP
jgi:RND family efflux transporter MFP subunit